MPIIQTEKVKAKKESLKKDVKKLRDNGIINKNLISELDKIGWNFPEFKRLFSSTRELCNFIEIDGLDYKGVIWRN